jgi:hypothetical protein
MKLLNNVIACALSALLLGACAPETDSIDEVDIESTEQGLSYAYNYRTSTGSGPIISSVGQEVTQEHPFRCDIGKPAVCFATRPGAGSGSYRYNLDPTANPFGYNIQYTWADPSSGPGLGNPLTVKLCMELQNTVVSNPTIYLGCTDVSAVRNGGTNAFNFAAMQSASFNYGYWGGYYSSPPMTLGYFPVMKFTYRFACSAAKPCGTPISPTGVIPQNSVSIYFRRTTY